MFDMIFLMAKLKASCHTGYNKSTPLYNKCLICDIFDRNMTNVIFFTRFLYL